MKQVSKINDEPYINVRKIKAAPRVFQTSQANNLWAYAIFDYLS